MELKQTSSIAEKRSAGRQRVTIDLELARSLYQEPGRSLNSVAQTMGVPRELLRRRLIEAGDRCKPVK